MLGLFVLQERRARAPLLPSHLFGSRQFAGANAATLLIYGALGALFFLLMVQLQNVMGYSALAAGASLLPINVCMLVLSPLAGRWAGAAGPRAPIATGALVAAIGLALVSTVTAEASYGSAVLPGIAAFGLGLGLIVAPLTSAILEAVDEDGSWRRLGGEQRGGAAGRASGHGGAPSPRWPGRRPGFLVRRLRARLRPRHVDCGGTVRRGRCRRLGHRAPDAEAPPHRASRTDARLRAALRSAK